MQRNADRRGPHGAPSHPRPRKSLGQHFLVDASAAARIVDALELQRDDALLEIGPGRGALTRRLAERVERMAVVELDRELAAALRREFPPERLLVFEADVLQLDLAAVLDALDAPPQRRLVVAGNLPYNISKPIVQRLVRERERVDRAVLMFQREVAQRLTARPGCRDYGPLGVLAGQAFDIASSFNLSPRAFRPRPKVDSTVTVWRRRADGLDPADEAALRRCLAVCFRSRRRTLRNNLRAVVGAEAEALLERTGIQGARRAEELTPHELLALAGALTQIEQRATDE